MDLKSENKANDLSLSVLHSGELYQCTDELITIQSGYLELQYDFNMTRPSEIERRNELLRKMFAQIGEGCYIEPPLHCNWGGKHVHFGKNVYCNFNLTLVDDSHIYIGDNTLIAPNVVIATGTHPVLPILRKEQYQFNIPVFIGKNVWIGAGSIILPGVHIGDDSVIGAGSVVTKDIPGGVVAFGNPCRVAREIGEKDRMFYYKDKKIPETLSFSENKGGSSN